MDWVQRRKDFIKDVVLRILVCFARTAGEDPSNMYKVIKGQQRPEIQKLFRFADALHCSIHQKLYLFYPDEYEQNIRICNEDMESWT